MTCPPVVGHGGMAVEARAYDALREAGEPELAEAYRAALPQARSDTLARVLAAAWREDVAGLRNRGARRDAGLVRAELPGGTLSFPVLTERAFARIEPGWPVLWLLGDGGRRALTHPVDLLAVLEPADPGPGWAGLAAELADATANLALAVARADRYATAVRGEAETVGATNCVDLARGRGAAGTILLERLSTAGHNLHPCARTRLGMAAGDLLRHDLEATEPTGLTLVGLRRDLVLSTPDAKGRDVGELLLDGFSHLAEAVASSGLDRDRYLFLPVHEWQLHNVVATRYRDEIAAGAVVPVPAARLRAEPTMALRTLLTEPTADGRRYFVKTALDIQVTSTRRTISAQTTGNGPAFSRLLDRIADAEPDLLGRTVLLPELAGASFAGSGAVSRDLSALVRSGLEDVAGADETVVPCSALYATSPLSGRTLLAELADRHPDGPSAFLTEYARLVLRPVLALMTGYGVGLEAHPQNALVVVAGGVPVRMVFRDWGGIRVHLPRLAASGHDVDVRPGSVTVTDRIGVTRAKVAYTAVQNHLGEVVARHAESSGRPEADAWRLVRDVVREVFAELRARPALRENADADEAALLARTLPFKGLVTMRLAALGGTRAVPAGADDRYLDLASPLWSSG